MPLELGVFIRTKLTISDPKQKDSLTENRAVSQEPN